MSDSNEKSGGWGWLLLLIAALVGLAVTKPDEAAHRAAVAERTPVTRALFSVGERLGHAEFRYHNYFLFSTMTAKLDRSAREWPVSYGFLGKVYYGKDK